MFYFLHVESLFIFRAPNILSREFSLVLKLDPIAESLFILYLLSWLVLEVDFRQMTKKRTMLCFFFF